MDWNKHKTKESSWWRAIFDPTHMFPNYPPVTAITCYCCVIVGVFLFLLILLWACSALYERKKSSKRIKERQALKEPGKQRKHLWSISKNFAGPSDTTNLTSMRKCEQSDNRNLDTLKAVDSMPWWDYVSKNPCVNWYDYYCMAERGNRAKAYERKRYPWRTSDVTNDARLKYHARQDSENARRLLPVSPYDDSCWENVLAKRMDNRYARSRPLADTSFFPRFHMIPRATWTDQRTLACLRGGLMGDYANNSLTSLTSTDMQIMRMVATRQQLARPTEGDVFYSQRMHLPFVHPLRGNQLSSYATQRDRTENTRRQEDLNLPRSRSLHTSTPNTTRLNDLPSLNLTHISPPPPSPPGYPPPPTPVSARITYENVQ